MLQKIDNCFEKVNILLKFIGMSVTEEDNKRTTWQRFKHHWICFINIVHLNLSICAQTTWLVLAIVNNTSLLQITFLLPCMTFCLLGNFKMYYFIHKVQNINTVILILRNFRNVGQSNITDSVEENIINAWLQVLINFCKLVIVPALLGVVSFIVGPFIMIVNYYQTTGIIKLYLPFILWYPFDEFTLPYWPFVFAQQIWLTWVSVACVLGLDSFFAVCCTFIQIQFLLLQRNFEQVINECSWKSENNKFKKQFVQVVNQHRELIRSVALIDEVYSKSTLFNVATSSLIICAAGFNLVVYKNYIMMAPFCSFLVYGLLQVFLYCFYSDHVMRSSMGVGDAIYNSNWHDVGVVERKHLLTVIIRAQKPCKFTAYLFSDVDLTVFSRILSTSWSYFALLNQMYEN